MTATATAIASACEGRIEIIRDTAGFMALAPAWDALWQRSGAPIFQSHAWISAWWNNIPDRASRSLVIATAWQGAQLQALLPLALHPHKGLRVLEWAGRDATDYCDLLSEPGTPASVLRQLWARAAAEARFDVGLLNRLLPEAKAWVLREPTGSAPRLRDNRRLEHSMRVTGDWADGAAWFDHFPKKIRQNYKRGLKFLEEGAESVQFRLLPPEEDFRPVLEQLAAFKRLWLEKTGIRAPLFDENAPLLPALARVLHEAGMLRIFVLERDAKVIAISMNFVEGRSLRAFVTAYCPDVERGSPGMVLMLDYIRWAFDNGLTEVDFLTGDEDFKNRFANEAVPLASLAAAGSPLGHLAMLADSASESTRALVRRLRHEPEAKPHPAG